MAPETHTNRLAGQTSPYLLQHAHNPVDWYPWGEEALRRAREEDRPILLSIGYAACHWCHVMERESFEDPDTAALMNASFVNVKVDREERPDLDAVYMDAVQAMTGRGGWPLTVFLTPDGQPFYGGTYFPPEDRHGMPAFRRVLAAVADAWRNRREEVARQGRSLTEAIARMSAPPPAADQIDEDVLRRAHAALARDFDPRWGGFGPAPKFPQPMTLEFLLRSHLRGLPGAMDMVEVTLDRMAAGGIFDHVGGGFHRYSVDGLWHVPHFEKMLYDNAQLARLYLRAWQAGGRRRDGWRRVAVRTLDYLLAEMRHPRGPFFSSQDADSEGVEGKFYVWPWDELVSVAGEDVARYLGAAPEGNWEGMNVLWTPVPVAAYAAEAGADPEEVAARVEQALARLLGARSSRVRPATDDKVLAGWNGLAVAAFAEAGRILAEPRYVEAAGAAARFVLDHLRDGSGRLLRSWRDGVAGGPGYADDHALMAAGCLELAAATLDPGWAIEARALAEALVALFHDREAGGFFQTGGDAEALVIRPKDLVDNAVPSGNSASAEALLRVALLTGDADMEGAAVSALRLVRSPAERSPTGFGQALVAMDLHLGPSREVAVVGPPDDAATRALAEVLWAEFRPNVVVAAADPADPRASEIPLLRDRPLHDGRPAAYVCERFACRLPVSEPADLARELASVRTGSPPPDQGRS